MKHPIILSVACATSVLVAAPASASERSGSFKVSLSIPTVCELSANIDPISPGSTGLVGRVSEYCNDSDGYQIRAHHRPLGSDEMLGLSYGGGDVLLDRSGDSVLASRTGPTLSTRALIVRQAALTEPVILSVSLTYL